MLTPNKKAVYYKMDKPSDLLALKIFNLGVVDTISIDNNLSTMFSFINNMSLVNSSLYKAVNDDDPVQVKKLLEKNADPNYVYRYKGVERPLLTITNNSKIIKLLLEHKADPNWNNSLNDQEETSVLKHNCNNIDNIKLLLEYKADPNITDRHGKNVLTYTRTEEVIEILHEHGIKLDNKNKNGDTLFHHNYLGETNTLNLLVKLKADPSICNNDGRSPLHMACIRNCTNTIEFLFKNGVSNIIVDKFGHCPSDYLLYKLNSNKCKNVLNHQPVCTPQLVDDNGQYDGRCGICEYSYPSCCVDDLKQNWCLLNETKLQLQSIQEIDEVKYMLDYIENFNGKWSDMEKLVQTFKKDMYYLEKSDRDKIINCISKRWLRNTKTKLGKKVGSLLETLMV